MPRREVHCRPMILPLLDNQPATKIEVDYWVEEVPGVMRVVGEYVADLDTWEAFAETLCNEHGATLVVEKR